MSYSSLGALFTAIANAIREKTSGSSLIKASDFPSRISEIETTPAGYHDTSVVTATAADVVSPKKIVDASGNELTGSIPSQAAGTFAASLSEQTILNAGKYLAGDQKLSAITVENLSAGNIKSGVTVKVKSGGNTLSSVTGTLASGNYEVHWGKSISQVWEHVFGHFQGGTTIVPVTRYAYEYQVPTGKVPKALFWKSLYPVENILSHGCAWDLNTAAQGAVNNAWGQNAILEAKTFVNDARTVVYIPTYATTNGGSGTAYFCILFV